MKYIKDKSKERKYYRCGNCKYFKSCVGVKGINKDTEPCKFETNRFKGNI